LRRCLLLVLLLALSPGAVSAANDAVPRLSQVLRTAKDFKQRVAAAVGLARLLDRQGVPALIEALKDAHPTVRGIAASALGKMGDPRGKTALEALLKQEKNDFVLGQAQSALALLLREGGAKPKTSPDDMQVDGTVGTLDEQTAEDGVRRRLGPAATCYTKERTSATYLAGKVVLKVRVAQDGKVRWVRFKRSDLGSIAAERCILTEMQQARFSAPEGGEAEFTIPLSFEPGAVGTGEGSGAAEPAAPPAGEAAKLRKACKKLLRGLSPPPALRVTMYVNPEGVVESAGMSADGNDIAPAFAQELVTRLKALKLGERDDGRVIKFVAPLACR
jgi:TonB family protein